MIGDNEWVILLQSVCIRQVREPNFMRTAGKKPAVLMKLWGEDWLVRW